MQPQKIIVFDFDGTITNVFTLVPEIGNRILQKLGKEPLTEARIRELQAMPLSTMLLYSGIPLWRVPWAVNEVRVLLGEMQADVLPHDGMQAALASIKADPTVGAMYILSSNSEANITDFLRRFELEGYFTDVIAGLGTMSKGRNLRRLIKTRQHRASPIIMIGDETRDIRAGLSAGAQTIAVTWGIGSKSQLIKARPTFIADHADELTKGVTID